MDVQQALARLGGVSDRASLVRATGRAAVDRALRGEWVVRDGFGRYALPVADGSLRAANALDGVASHRSAALLHGWEVARAPACPDVRVPKSRKVSPSRRAGVSLHRGSFTEEERRRRRTSPTGTLRDCLRSLPFDEALSVADSALRHRAVTHDELVALAATVRGPGAVGARRVAEVADGRAANPFESVLRAIALDVPGLAVEPQVPVTAPSFSVRPDLVDVRLRLVLEAESFAWHGDRASLRWDAQRYNNLVVRGWTVLRFAWEDVMHDQAYVHRILVGVVAVAGGPTDSTPGASCAA